MSVCNKNQKLNTAGVNVSKHQIKKFNIHLKITQAIMGGVSMAHWLYLWLCMWLHNQSYTNVQKR